MRRRFTLFLFLPAVVLMPVLVVLFGACASQGEGERCSPEAGNAGADDCQSGLECLRTNNANAVYRCCPADRTRSTTAACALPGTVDANSSVPEATTLPEASSDAPDLRLDGSDDALDGTADGSDASADGLLEGATDAPAEALLDVATESTPDGRASAETSTDAAAEATSDGSGATAD